MVNDNATRLFLTTRKLDGRFFYICLFIFSLIKNYTARPNYNQLLELDFIREHAQKGTNVAEFVGEILDLPENEQPV